MATTQSSSTPPPDRFHRFADFPAEIRLRIWNLALDNATAERKIHLAIHTLIYVVNHKCLSEHGRFCGLHSHCEALGPDEDGHGEGITKLKCMADGHFALAETYSEPDDDASRRALSDLSLACHESRHLVIERYPQKLRVFPGEWSQGMPSRILRFHPINDTPIFTGLPGFTCAHPHPGRPDDELQDLIHRGFPRDASLFREFRDALSSIRCVSFRHSGQRGYLHYAFEAELYQAEAFRDIILFFESMERLYLWLDPSWWPYPDWKPDTGGDVIDLDNIEELAMTGIHDIPYVVSDSQRVLERYQNDSQMQISLYIHSDEDWMPQPQVLTNIGCYLAPERLCADDEEGNYS